MTSQSLQYQKECTHHLHHTPPRTSVHDERTSPSVLVNLESLNEHIRKRGIMTRENQSYHWLQDYILEALGNNLLTQHLLSFEIILTHIEFQVTGGMDYHQEAVQMLAGCSAQCDKVAPWLWDHHPSWLLWWQSEVKWESGLEAEMHLHGTHRPPAPWQNQSIGQAYQAV